MAFSSSQNRILTVLRASHYGRYVAGNTVNLIGTWMQWIGVGWLAWTLTGSTFWLGLVSFADLFPVVILGPIAGAFADRWNRLTMLKVTQSLACLQAILLFLFAISGWLDAYTLLALALMHGVVTAFGQSARLALVPSLVSQEHLGTAVGINSVVFNLARFIGPMVAAFVINIGEIAWVFAANAATFVFFLYMLSRIELLESMAKPRVSRHILSDLIDGLSYVISHRQTAIHLLLLMIFFVCARPMVDLLPAFADRVFQGGATVLSLLTSSLGVGAIIGGIWLAQRPDAEGLEANIIIATLLSSVAIWGFLLSPTLWTALPAVTLAGAGFVVIGAGTQTVLQLNTPSDMRGRVMSLYGVIIRGGPAIGALIMGALAEVTGLVWPLAIGAAIVAGSTWIIKKKLL